MKKSYIKVNFFFSAKTSTKSLEASACSFDDHNTSQFGVTTTTTTTDHKQQQLTGQQQCLDNSKTIYSGKRATATTATTAATTKYRARLQVSKNI